MTQQAADGSAIASHRDHERCGANPLIKDHKPVASALKKAYSGRRHQSRRRQAKRYRRPYLMKSKTFSYQASRQYYKNTMMLLVFV